MPHIAPIPREDLPQYEPMFELVEGAMGFVPSSLRTMARRPELLEAFAALSVAVLTAPETSAELKHMVSHVVSTAAGCRYCQAHTAAHLIHDGGDPAKVEALWEFETSDLFTDAERAALRFARDAGAVPNAVTAEHFDQLGRHFSEEQVIELAGVIAMFGYLNRWNDTMATELEDVPAATGASLLTRRGWEPGKHTR